MLPIILIHGFPLDNTMWQAQVDYLTGKGHTVIAPNLPGFGNPAPPPIPLEYATIDAYAEYIHGIIQKQAGGRAIVGGLSMGGYILLALLREHPDSVAAAMLLDTRADPDTAEARAARLKSIQDVQEKGPGSIIDGLLTKQLRKKPLESNKQKVRAIMERQSAQAIITAQTAMSKRRDHTDLLAQLTLPVLIVVGSEDALTPPSVALAMQSHMPHAMVAQIVNAGHLTTIEQPDAVNSTIETFLTTVHEPSAEASA
jgi:pimeloyl-ACP methyl ester carboxylesterase